MTTVILCGMPSEKIVLAKAFPSVLVLTGTDKLNLPALVPNTCTRIVSMGLAGGLSPDLSVPDVAIASTVVDHTGSVSQADPAWNAMAVAALTSAAIVPHIVPYYSSGLFDEADNKNQRAAIYKKYGAHAIDDETRYVVTETQRRGVPFNVVRPLSDDYRDTLPLMATGKIMNPDGSPNISYLLSALGQDQGEDSETVFTVFNHYKQSLDALENVAEALANTIGEK